MLVVIQQYVFLWGIVDGVGKQVVKDLCEQLLVVVDQCFVGYEVQVQFFVGGYLVVFCGQVVEQFVKFEWGDVWGDYVGVQFGNVYQGVEQVFYVFQ